MNHNEVNLKIKNLLGEKSKILITKLLYPFRNKFCLFNIFNSAKKNEVNLNYWNESANLGDTLAPVIVNYMLEKKKINPNSKISQTQHLYAVGSVLTAGIQDSTVWGSGILNATLTYRLKNRLLDIRSVRGPITRAILIDYGYKVPEVYGDPALLMPEIYNPENIEKEKKYGLIFHKDYLKNNKTSDVFNTFDSIFIDIKTDDFKSFVNEILSVHIVISSSLHGIILAEAYGIPAILLKPKTDILKYYDYYYSTNRTSFPIADDIQMAIKMNPVDLPDFSVILENIKSTFPYDIYMK